MKTIKGGCVGVNKYFAASLAIIALSLFFSLYALPSLPGRMAIHWNASGMPDGFGSKNLVFLQPALAFILLLLMWYIPLIDPLKKNIDKFRNVYNQFIFIFILFLSYLNVLSVAFNLGWISQFNLFFAPAFAVLFYFVGILLEHAKPSWFIGIRTPWTLSSEYSWQKTHELGAKLFKAFAIAFLLISILAPEQAFFVLIGLMVAAVVILILFSYLKWKEDKKKTGKAIVAGTQARKRAGARRRRRKRKR